MLKEKILPDSRTPYKYMVIIDNGIDFRLFKDFSVLCELMGLDAPLLDKWFKSKSSYTAYDFTVFKVKEETSVRNRGYHN